MPYTYLCSTTATGLAESKNTGTPSVRVAFRTLQDVASGTPVAGIENAPQALYADLWLTEKTTERTIQTLREVMGWKGNSFEELNTGSASPLVGVEVEVVWDYEEYEGKYTPKVQWVNSVGGGGMKKAEPEVAARVAARFDSLLRAGGYGGVPRAQAPIPPRVPGGQRQRSAPRPATAPGLSPAMQNLAAGADDDLPF